MALGDIGNDYYKCAYTVPRPFRRQLSRCRRKVVEGARPGARYCRIHICPCGNGPRTHAHNQKPKENT